MMRLPSVVPPLVSRPLAFAWRHGSAVVALACIVLAGIVGHAIGRPAAEPAAPTPSAAAPAGPATMYTCSMHPAVRLPDPKAKCPICFMDLIPAPEGDAAGASSLAFTEAALAAAHVETARVARFFPTAEVRLYGKVAVDETTVSRITAYFPGRLERLFVNYVGVPVRAGDHLAEIYSPELLAAFEELRQARLAADAATTGSELVRRTIDETLRAARERLRLFGLTAEQVEGAETGTLAGDAFTIYAPAGGVVTSLAAREGDYLQTGTPIATVADLARLWLDLEAYESQLPLLRWGQSVRFTVESHPGESFEGRISFIEPIVDERTRTAAVRVAVEDVDGRLKPGMFASAVVRTRVGSGGAVVSDELAGRWVSPMHPTIVKDHPGTCDICGMDLVPAESLGVVGDPADVREPLVVPRTAVLVTGRRAIAYVRVPGSDPPRFEGREIVLGPRAGDHFIVEAGLDEGEEIVVRGAFRIDSAMQIAAKPSMMTPTDGDGDDDAADGTAAALPERFLDSLEPVYAAYLDAQEALADDDLAAFAAAAARIAPAVEGVDAAGVLGAPLAAWRTAAAALRSPVDVATIDAARAVFETLSSAALDLARRFGHAGAAPWHHAYCPMAFDFKGAAWLQRGDEIDNPYFGAEMLRCGEIRATLPARDAEGDGE